jgi:hypothetical protein
MADARAEGKIGKGRKTGKLTAPQVLEIVALRRKYGIKTWVLAERFGVSTTAITYILAGKSWAKITGIERDPTRKGGRPRKAPEPIVIHTAARTKAPHLRLVHSEVEGTA